VKQFIVVCFVFIAAHSVEFFFNALARGDVLFDGNVVRDPVVFINHRRDCGLLGEEVTVLVPIDDLSNPRLSLFQLAPEGLIKLRGCVPDFNSRGFSPMTSSLLYPDTRVNAGFTHWMVP
jgi:hypothetical protein